MQRLSLSLYHRRFLLFCLFSAYGAVFLVSQKVWAANADGATPTPEEQSILDQYPSFSDTVHILEPNPGGAIQQFLNANEGKTVWLDTTILRYAPIDMSQIDDPNLRATTDRFENAVYKKCWPQPVTEIPAYFDFGKKGFPLPVDAADIEAGCANRIRFVLLKDDLTSPGVDVLHGDNKAQLSLSSFFQVAKSQVDGKTLYTLTQQDVPFDTVLLFDKHKRIKERPVPELGIPDKKRK